MLDRADAIRDRWGISLDDDDVAVRDRAMAAIEAVLPTTVQGDAGVTHRESG